MFFSGAASTYSLHSRPSCARNQHYARHMRRQLLLGHGSDSVRVGLFMLMRDFDFAREM